MAQSTSRLGLDIEEIERQMRQARPAPPSKVDPLADLARIVGQDDPFRTVLANDQGGRSAARHARPDEPNAASDEAFERMLSEEADRGAHRHANEAEHHTGAGFDSDDAAYPTAVDDLRRTERSRSRKGLVTVGIVVGIGVLAVGGALTMFRGGSSVNQNGEPPVIQAEREPLKVRPENPGGVDIPDQNKQIYERGAQDGQTKVVNREEQPLDVREAARALPPTPAPAAVAAPIPQPSASPSLGTPSPAAMAALGEPRRVRTVTVRPDGSFVTPGQGSSASPTPAAPKPPAGAPIETMATTRSIAAEPPRTETGAQGATTPQSAAVPSRPPMASAPRPQPAAPPQPSPVPAPVDPSPQRTASILTRPPVAAPETTAAGAFSVQLAVGATEPEARTLATNLRQRFAGDLGSRSPAIRRAELNGKTLYRVRVEQLSRDEANALCAKLRTAGGQCFIAKN